MEVKRIRENVEAIRREIRDIVGESIDTILSPITGRRTIILRKPLISLILERKRKYSR